MANAYGSVTALSGNANGAANGTYTSLGVIDFTTTPPHECLVEVSVFPSSTTYGNQQVVLLLRDSIDGTNFSVAPSSADFLNSRILGTLYLPTVATRRSIAFPISPQYGGALPQKVEVFLFNDTGTTLTSATGQYRTETFG